MELRKKKGNNENTDVLIAYIQSLDLRHIAKAMLLNKPTM